MSLLLGHFFLPNAQGIPFLKSRVHRLLLPSTPVWPPQCPSILCEICIWPFHSLAGDSSGTPCYPPEKVEALFITWVTDLSPPPLAVMLHVPFCVKIYMQNLKNSKKINIHESTTQHTNLDFAKNPCLSLSYWISTPECITVWISCLFFCVS